MTRLQSSVCQSVVRPPVRKGPAVFKESTTSAAEKLVEMNLGGALPMASTRSAHTAVARLPWNRFAAYLLAIVAMVFTMVGLLPQSVRADEATGDEGISTYALSDHTVQGLSPNGTTINLFDYWVQGRDANDQDNGDDYLNRGINANHTLKFGAGMGQSGDPYVANSGNVNQWTISAQPRTGIVKNTLGADGYPVLSDTLGGTSLSYLFNSEAQNGKAVYTNVDGLLQVDNDGYFYYNSQSNFAQFNEGTNGFTLYDEGGVTAAGSSPFGQFFPFNTGDQVFVETGGQLDGHGIKSNDPQINHYFGMTMSTRFVQQYGGYTADESDPNRKQVTYEFSGDDDVWIYIDGVLVGDLGGIHDASSISINFATGSVVINEGKTKTVDLSQWETGAYYDNGWKKNVSIEETTTLKALFEAADVDTSEWNGNTFADDTFHTLDFFYLERGNTDSNMSLKYNLVYIPESDIVKVDQASEPIAGVEFKLYATGSDYVVSDGAESTYVGYTDAQGIMRIANKDGYTVSLSEMKNVSDYWVLRETTTPSGYRSIEDVPLYFESKITTHSILLSAEPWDTGAYAQPKLTSTTTQNGIYSVDGDRLDNNGVLSGRMFAVVMQKGDDGKWYPITGDALEGWHVSSTSGLAGAVETAQNGDADRFIRNSNGLYQVDVTDMPGDIKTYKWIIDNNDTGVEAEYAVQYFYTSASQASQATTENTVQVRTDTNRDLVRQFSMQLYVSNIENRFIVRKVDDTGAAVNGATFALYNRSDVAVDQNGNWTTLPSADPIAEVTTATIDLLGGATGQTYELDGAAVIGKSYNGTKLVNGEYYLLETSSPNNAVVNKKAIEIVVDDTGVYANAGTNNDGVLVARGIGRVIGSMQQFTVDDNVDATLHDVKAAIVTSDEYSGDSTNWPEPNWDRTETDGDQFATAMHLQYSDPGDNLPGVVFDYAPIKAGGLTALTTEVGWSKLIVEQCLDHDDGTVSNKTGLGTKDISHLFSGTLVIQVTNVPMGDFELSKTVDPATVADSFTFDLEFEQQLPADNEETGEATLSTATANYIKTLFPGDYKYTITDESGTAEQGTLTIGEATASGENPGGDTSGEGSTEASAKYIITSVELSGGAGSAYFVARETAGYQVKLAHGETLTINDLPVYTQITATEVKPAGSYLTTVEATPEVTVTKATASDVEADVDAEGEGNSATDGTETETAVDGENTADGTDGDNTDAATIEGLALDEEESAVTDGEQMTDADEDGGADVSNETVAPQALATSVYTATTIIEKQVAGEAADAPVSYNASIAFTNIQSANATINVQKTLVGTDWTTDKGAYQFTITASEETPNAPLPDPAEITIDAKSDDSFDEGSETEPTEPPSATVRVGSFGEIAFTGVDKNSKFVYEISETNPTGEDNGWTYDNHTVKVTVTFHQVEGTNELVADVAYDNSDALTEADKAEQNAAAFTNTYSATTTYAGLEIVKEMSGRDLTDNEFSFSIVPAGNNPSHGGIDALFADGGALSKPISFDTDHDTDGATISAFEGIEFTQDDDGKEFLFTVSEVIPEENDRELGVTYDQSQYEVKIKVVDNGNGTIHTVTTVTKTVDADGKAIEAADRKPVEYDSSSENTQTPSMTFANSYETQPTSSDGVGDGTFTKSFTGRAWTENDSFTFDLSKVSYQENDQTDPVIEGPDFDNMPMPNPASVTVTSKDLNENSTTDASFGFGEITFSKPGIYTYKVVEKDAGTTSEGISYSDNVATVVFTVAENNPQNGQYSVECEITYSDEIEKGMFANVYTSTGALDGETDLAVEKTFTGRVDDEWTKDDIFTFVLTGPDGAPMPLDSVDGKKEITVDASNVGENGVATSNFGDIAYTQDDDGKTYTYTIEEIAGSVQGVFYSKATYKVTVTISDNGNGTLNIEKTVTKTSDDNGDSVDTAASDMTFANTYTPENASYDPQGEHGVAVTKNVKSSDDQLTAAGYTFTMTVVNDATNDSTGVQNATQEKTSDSNGNVTFDNVTFTQAGDYTVTVAETKGNDANMTYDEHKLVYTVKVTDNGQGQLVAEVDQSTVSEGENVFTNVYYDEEDAKHVYDAEGALIDGKLVGVGETLTYKIDWVNTATGEDGSPSAGTVTVVDTLPEGTTVVPGSISEGGKHSEDGRSITWIIEAQAAQTGTVSFQVTVDEAAAGSTLQNKATVNGSETNSVANPVPGKTETTNPDAIGEGTVLTYQISFANTDGEGASAQVIDTLTQGQAYNAGSATVKVGDAEAVAVEPSVSGDAASGQTLTWSLSDLPAGAEVVVAFDVTVTRDAGTSVDNTATVNGHKTNTTTTPYPSDDKKDVAFADEPEVSIDGKLVGVGDTLTYTIDWAAGDEGGTVTVTDTLPAGTAYVDGSADNGGSYDEGTNTITWDLGNQPAGARGTVSFDVTVTDEAVTVIENTATIEVGENAQDVSVAVDFPKKEAIDTTPDTGYQVGDVIEYTIEYRNDTDAAATVTVTDSLPEGLDVALDENGSEIVSAPGSYDSATHTITWTFEDLPAGTEGIVTFSARVNEQATVVEDPLTNQATIKIGNNEYKTNTTGGDPDEQPKTGELTISKEIVLTDGQGTVIDEDKEFTFEVALIGTDGQSLTGTYKYAIDEAEVQDLSFANGSATITLTHGQTAKITGLPEGARYTVHEILDPEADAGYRQTAPAGENGAPVDAEGAIVSDAPPAEAAFTNTYSVTPTTLSGATYLRVTKVLEGRDWLEGDSFTFVLAAGDEVTQAAIDGNPDEGVDPTVVMPAETAVVLQGGYTDGQQVPFSFGDITFKAAGVYTFTIAEQQPGDEGFVGNTGGMAYDSHVRTVVVSVADNGQGGLTATVAASDGDTNWTNTYTPVFDGATTVNLNGTKVLEGSTLAAGQFFFSVAPLDGAPMGDTWESGNTNGLGASGALENVGDIELLRNVTYTVADMGGATEKTFRYVVTEEIPSEDYRTPGLTYDGSAYLVSVTVTDDLAGNLVASAPSIERGVWDGTAFTADEDQAGVEGVVFTNGYTVSGTTAAPVQVTKVLAGNRTAPLAAGEFEFELGIVSADPADGLTLPEETTASNAADGTVSFGEVSFSKPGTYVLSVAEVVPEGAEQNGDGSYTLDGVTYDAHAVTMTYTVVDQNAQLVATLGAVEGDTTFTNTYNATETLDGAANLTVTKAVEGDFTWKEGTSFTFALTGADIATQEAIANGTVVLPDNADGIAIAYNAADPDAPHTASFGDITFKAAGDYLFAITEQQGDIAGMTYDVEQHLVGVAVTDNGDGTLTVVPNAATMNPTITNTYEPTEAVLSGAGNLTVTKNLVGRDWQEGDSFTFMLEADMDDEETASAMNDGAIRLPGNAGGITVAFDANDPEAAHSASFGDIAFTRAGTYRFTVTELAGSIDGVVYDTTAHEVAVTVVDNGDGTLGFAADGVVGANPTVTNVFTAPIDYSARSEIVISKTLDGRPATDGQFSFTVTPADEASALKLGIPEDGYTLSTPAAGDGEKASVGLFATLAADGIAPLAFTSDDAGTTFSYTVAENGTAPDGYTYDASVYTVDITVTDDPSAGGLTVATQVSDGAGYTMMTTVTNATEFAQPVEIPFVNSYRASTDVEGGAAAVVNGTKELVGTAMREFSFVLEGVAGTNTEGYTNTAVNDGTNFSFTLDYDQDSFTAGATADENGNRSEDFVYTLREVGGGDVTGGITYDDARYRATVTVTDNGDGTMAASVTKLEQLVVDEAGTESWIPADAAAFTNTYAAATSVALDVDKVLSGRDMTAADSYEFVAYAYDRATQAIDRTSLVATGSTPAGQTAADGAAVPVDMSDIEYTVEGLNADAATPWVDVTDEYGQPTGARTKTYDYAIEEVVGADLNVSYAPEVFYAQVVVTDDGQGNLSAAKTYFADAAMQQPMVGEDGSSTVPTFVNTYLPDATSFHLTGTKTTTFVNVDPGTEPELRFMYDIYLEENGASELVASGWSYANGTVSADIPVTGEGSFTYRIVERYAGTTSGTVTYDDAVYYLTLEVARNADTGIYDFAPTYYRVEDDGTWTQIDAAGLTFANTYDGAAGTTVSLGATKVLEGATFEQLGQLNDKFGFSLYEGDEYTGTKLGEGTITGVDANGNGIVTFPNLTYTFYLQDQPETETPEEGEQPEGGEAAETPEEGAEGEVPEGGQTDQGGQTGTGENGTTVPSDPNAGQPSGEDGSTEPDQPAEPSGDAGAVEPVEPVTPAEPDQPAADVPAETPSVDETPAVEGTPEVAPEAPAEDASGDAGVQAASIADLFVASEAIADDADAEPFTVDIVDTGAEVAEVADGAAGGVAESAADGQTGTSGETAPAAPAEPVIVSDDLGTHVYTIVENVPAGSTQNEDGTWTAPNGVTYDGTKYRVTVEVEASYDAATQKATMTATVTGIARSDSHGSFEDGHATPVDPTNPAASIVFTNSYTARQPVEVSFAGTKNLTGRDMAEGEFSFAVLEGETPVATATNAADGTVSFSFGVTTPGTHTYTVVEADGGKGGVDYDTAPRTVVVEVGVNPDGTLAVESVALPEGGLVFNNTYTASGSTEAVIEGTKALTGRTMAEGEFRFVVVETVDGVENIVAAGENQAPGEDGVAAITFAPIAYDAEDLGKTFTYQVRELDLGAGGVTYDTAAFTVQVAVVDDLDGTISTEVTYLDGPVAFENSYGTVDGAKVEVTPEATKTLTGRDMVDGEFVFTVTDAATGNVVATGANTADGKVVWDAPITLTAKGDYEFVIAEVNGRQDGVTYDDATYRLLVTVADDGEGGLTVESLDYPDGAPAFSNSYEEPEKPVDPDKPSIPGGPTESVPQTGDDTNLAAAAALGLGGLGAALLGGGALLRRRASR